MAYPVYPSTTAPGISIGTPIVMAQTTIYALPGRACRITSTAALELSVDGTTFAAVAATTTGVDSSYAFARCTGSTATIVCKPIGQ